MASFEDKERKRKKKSERKKKNEFLYLMLAVWWHPNLAFGDFDIIFIWCCIFFSFVFLSLNDIHIIYIFFTAIVQVMSIPFAAYYNYVAVQGMSTAWHVCVCIYTVKMVLPHLRYWLAFFDFCRCCFLNFFLVLSRLHKTILFLTVAAVFCFMLFVQGRLGGGGGGGGGAWK